MSEPLYHFTCGDSKRKIRTSNGLLIPRRCHPLLGCKVIWLTTEAVPDREATGLGNSTGLTSCNRMEFRYIVSDRSQCRPWLDSAERSRALLNVVLDLESYGDPEHWWISDKPVQARLDRSWVARD